MGDFMSFSLLGQVKINQTSRPAFFLDLNIDQIVKAVTEDWGEHVEELYYTLPESKDITDYRRAVYQDVKKEGALEAFLKFLECMKQRDLCHERKEKVEDVDQKCIWHIREVASYLEAVKVLQDTLEQVQFISTGLQELKQLVKNYMSEKEFVDMKKEAEKLYQELSSFRMLITYESDRFTIAEGAGAGEYENFLKETFPNHEKVLKSPFLSSVELFDLEWEFIKVFRKKHKDFFQTATHFYKTYKNYEKEEIGRLQTELAYYIAYLQFEQKMQEKGFEFCMPEDLETKKELSAEGLYDLALATISVEEDKEVVANDMRLEESENFFVLTGPNQGGKTTFARSLGQLVYFSQMGLNVPARAARVPYYTNILTHFSVEESVESGRGKLMDELMRLVPMMGEKETGAFVVINELFTTAANYDACIMGKKVLEYFIGNQCKGIYVTHLNELTSAHETIVSLRATVDENLVQTYHVERSEAKELAGANRQVEKYKLTYEQIKERFA